ncbi:MAG: hypothetical protein KC492_02580 [Myxococcales bacterium]|nr:hypothetical protein [Myxococcales bacterium]
MTTRREVLSFLTSVSVGAVLPGCLPEARPAPFEAVPDRESARQQMTKLSLQYEALMIDHAGAVLRALEHQADGERRLADCRAREARLLTRAERLLEYHEALLPPAASRSWQLGALGGALLEDAETTALERRLRAAQQAPVSVGQESLERDQVDAMVRAKEPQQRDLAVQALTELQRRSAPIAKELLHRRKARARELGEDYYEALLRVRRVQLSSLEELAQAFVRATDDETRGVARSLQRMMRVGVGRRRGSYAPYDSALALDRLTTLPVRWFPREQASELAHGVATDLGLNALARSIGNLTHIDSGTGARSIYCLGEALSLPVSIPAGLRPLVRSAEGFAHWRMVMLELGRLAQFNYVAESEPVLKGYPWLPGLAAPTFDRAMPEVFAGLLMDQRMLERYAKLPARQAFRVGHALRTRSLFELRQSIAWMTFERRALANPKQDLDRLAGQVSARLTGLNAPVFWATDPRLTNCPGMEPAALAGRFLAYAVVDWLLGQSGAVDAALPLTRQRGEKFRAAILRPGVSRSADARLLALDGHRLSARPAIRLLTSRPPRATAPITL